MPFDRSGKPVHLLFATDLSARCDRALDRAVALAEEWGARLTVVHALEDKDFIVTPLEDFDAAIKKAKERAWKQMRRDIGADRELEVVYLVEHGRAEDVVLDAIKASDADFIVTGTAKRNLLGNTVETLTRKSTVPVLIVKDRPNPPYRRILTAADLSQPSEIAFEYALRLFHPQDIALFHAFDLPFRNWTDDHGDYEAEMRIKAETECRAFLERVAGPEKAGMIPVIAQCGDPAALIGEFTASGDTDLVITGTHGRSGLMSVLLGSTASRILEDVSCDILVVPAAHALKN